jgi:ketosteroid isomerase-like protein
MKHAFAWMMALALIIPQTSAAEGNSMTQDQHDVLRAIETMTSSFQANDISAVMAAYETAPTVLFEPGVEITGDAMVEQMFTGMASVSPKFTYPAGHDVIVNGDTALHISPWQMTATGADGERFEQTGLSVAVLHRQADGGWKMVIDNPHGGRLLPQE